MHRDSPNETDRVQNTLIYLATSINEIDRELRNNDLKKYEKDMLVYQRSSYEKIWEMLTK